MDYYVTMTRHTIVISAQLRLAILMRIMQLRFSIILALVLLSPVSWASDIYGYVDSDGVAHFSNIPDLSRYRLVLREHDDVKTMDRYRLHRGNTEILAPFDAQRRYAQTILREAQANQLDPWLIDAVIAVESNHNPGALSPAGAAGLMQLMPDTAKRYGVANPYHAESNIRGGARYLRDLLSMFDGDLNLALAAYNAGENAVLRYGTIPPYAETRDYVPRVMRKYAALKNMKPANYQLRTLP